MKIVFQKDTTNLGNDCVIHRLYLIFEWLGKYVIKGYIKVDGWCDHGIEDMYFDKDTFYDFDDAKRAIDNAMRNNCDYEDGVPDDYLEDMEEIEEEIEDNDYQD